MTTLTNFPQLMDIAVTVLGQRTKTRLWEYGIKDSTGHYSFAGQHPLGFCSSHAFYGNMDVLSALRATIRPPRGFIRCSECKRRRKHRNPLYPRFNIETLLLQSRVPRRTHASGITQPLTHSYFVRNFLIFLEF